MHLLLPTHGTAESRAGTPGLAGPPGTFHPHHTENEHSVGTASARMGLAAARALRLGWPSSVTLPGGPVGLSWTLVPQFPKLMSCHLRGAPGTELVSEEELVRVMALEQGLVP